MKRTSTKKKVVIILAVIYAVIVIPTFILTRVPQRLAAYNINRKSNLPHGFLSKADFRGSNYGGMPGFGVATYYDLKYVEEGEDTEYFDPDDKLDTGNIVIYEVTAYPDYSSPNSSRVTRLRCSDPEYSIFGHSAGDDVKDFSKALRRAGYIQDGYLFKQCGIRIFLRVDEESEQVLYFSISVEISNMFHIMF